MTLDFFPPKPYSSDDDADKLTFQHHSKKPFSPIPTTKTTTDFALYALACLQHCINDDDDDDEEKARATGNIY